MEKTPVRKIIHVDMDAFFASVEIRDNPSLRGLPVVVGGMPGTRGVVCTASYEARKYGIHSAMSANKAYALCPHAVFLPPRFSAYKKASGIMHGIFHEYTDLVEGLSLDEAYLDVTENKKNIPYASTIAREIREKIRMKTGLTASAGVSATKFVAKIASDLRKPDALTVVPPDRVLDLLKDLPVEKFYGIGCVTAEKMHSLGIRTGLDLRKYPRLELIRQFGSAGDFYYGISRGIDPRPVMPERERKSLGVEETFEKDTYDLDFLKKVLSRQADEVSSDLRTEGLLGRTVTVKIKYADFRSVTRSQSAESFFNDSAQIRSIAFSLLKKTEAGRLAVRLAGLTVSGFPAEKQKTSWTQMELKFPEETF